MQQIWWLQPTDLNLLQLHKYRSVGSNHTAHKLKQFVFCLYKQRTIYIINNEIENYKKSE